MYAGVDHPAMSRKEWKEEKKKRRNVKKTERKKKRIDRKNPTTPQRDHADVRAGIQRQAGGFIEPDKELK